MCGRYGFSVKDAKEIYERFDVYNALADFKPLYNIAPGQFNPVITRHSPNSISRMFWGMIPFWAKNYGFKFKTINARAEGIEDNLVYRKPFRLQRCLIPATGFYEWDKSQKPSQPYYFRLNNEEIFAFAGLYDIWKNPEDEKEIQSYTIITTQANGIVGKIHARMPVILKKTAEDIWLNPDIIEPEMLLPFLIPFANSEMVSYKVSMKVNVPTRNDPELINPVSDNQV
jgi:putative SOS response-associated peptidase YedK